jgi:beta-lactamase class A
MFESAPGGARPHSRRAILTTILGGGVVLGGCGSGPAAGRRAAAFDATRLAAGYAVLAERARPGTLGLGVTSLGAPTLWCAVPAVRFPMQSVSKAPLAAAALAEIDAGRLRFNEPIAVEAGDLAPMNSRLNARFGGQPLSLPAADLIALAVQESDSTAADVLMRRIGGPAAVTAWLAARGLGDMRIDSYDHDLQPRMIGLGDGRPEWAAPGAWTRAREGLAPSATEAALAAYLADPRDTTTVPAALKFLALLGGGGLLSPASGALLLRLMTATRAGEGRLRAGLPRGASLAHQTGTAPTVLGLTAAANDIGLAALADGRRFAIAVFLSGATATDRQRDALIADAGRLAVAALI